MLNKIKKLKKIAKQYLSHPQPPIYPAKHPCEVRTPNPQPNHPPSPISHLTSTKAFTIFELLITTTIIAIMSGASMYIYISFQKAKTRLKMSNELYDKTRIFTEVLAKEIRTSYIDYEEYYNQKDKTSISINQNDSCYLDCQNTGGTCTLGTKCSELEYNKDEKYGNIGQCYGAYARLFYEGPSSEIGVCSKDIKFLGQKKDKISGSEENALAENANQNLYLINLKGNTRTFFKFYPDSASDGCGTGECILKKLKLVCCENTNGECSIVDEDDDGICRKWGTHLDFSNDQRSFNLSNFVDITPNGLLIKEINFGIYPKKDPHLAFKDDTIKYHPYVRITIKAESLDYKKSFPKENPLEVSLSTTVSVRSYKNIKSFL